MAEKTPEEMREAVLAIREKMAAAAREAGRDPAEVQLCAACKTRTAETVAASAALPIDVFGENHVQELCANFDAGAYCGKPSHFIGHLQTNKIKKVLGRASLIQSVGSEHLLTAIEKEAAKAGIVQNVLLEVNIGGEESKSGVSPETLWPLLDAAAAQEHIRVKGLMAIPPVNDDDAQNRRYLAAVHDLFVKAGERGYANVEMQTLSMGMSGDYENAIREGATLVRIGTQREASSGCYAAMALRPLTAAGEALMLREHHRLCREWRWLSQWVDEKVPLADVPEAILTEDDWLDLAGFAFAHRPMLAALGSLHLLCGTSELALPPLRGRLSGENEQALCARLGLHGRKALLVRLREEAAQAMLNLDEVRTNQLMKQVQQLQFF